MPASVARTSTCRPATYVAGSASSHEPSPIRAAVAVADARSAAEVSTTVFGTPVDPEVVIRIGSSECSAAGNASEMARGSPPSIGMPPNETPMRA